MLLYSFNNMEIDVFCSYPFTRCRVTSEGHVAMCCFQRPDPLSDESPYIGNLLEQSFDEIWFGERAEQIRLDTTQGVLSKRCQVPGCPVLTMKQPYKTSNTIYNEYPIFLEIDLPNTHCNVGGEHPGPDNPACIMCERSAGPDIFKPEKDHLSEVIPKLINIVPNLKQIHIQGIAEPFYKDLIFHILDWLDYDKYREQITISTTTNATLFKPAVRRKYLDRCPHSITNFSLDAATPKTFKKIRIFDCFDKILENIYAFNKERVRPRQFLRIHNNLNILNVHEVVGMVEIAAKADAEYVEFNPTDGFNHKILVNHSNCGLFRKAQEDIVAACERLKVPYNFLRPLDLGMTEHLVQITL
jgi:molybdenum cofactor biosynthesis enzyme MoaA